jgi:hypothetical protein
MKKVILTVTAVVGLSASLFAQGTITADNLNGTGNNSATSFGLFFANNGTAYTSPTLNVALLGGASAGSLSAIATFTGANAWVSFGGGQYADPNSLTYAVPGVALGAAATLQVEAWTGASATYGAAGVNQFGAWNGAAWVDASTFTFSNATGGNGAPPAFPHSLDGMPAMELGTVSTPEPSTIALAGLGAASLLMFRRRKA